MTPPRPLAALPVALTLALAAAGPPPALSGLNPNPLVAEPIGLRMHLPAGAAVLPQVADGAVSYAVTGGENSPWSIRIAPINPAVPEPSPEALLAERIDAVKTTGRPHRVIANGPFTTSGGVRGRLLYLEQTLDDQQRLVNGWLILPTSPRTFLVFAFLTTAEHFPRIRAVLEASFSTIELRSQAELLDERHAQLERGRAIVGTFTPQRLRQALGERQYRLYRPAPPGQPAGIAEVGFMNLRCVEAPRGQLTPERSPQSYSALETKRGLMVLLEARVIINADENHYLDLDGRYWMNWDRSTEAWSIRQTRRQGQASKTTAETGVRDLANLEVIHSQKEQFTRDPTRWSVPDTAFLAQPEVLLLGSLLPRDGSVSGGVVFYYYDTRRQQLTQRLDRWAPAQDGTGHWLLTSQPMLDVASITQRFDTSGTRVERIDADGTVTRRIDPADLRRLWQSKGLLTR